MGSCYDTIRLEVFSIYHVLCVFKENNSWITANRNHKANWFKPHIKAWIAGKNRLNPHSLLLVRHAILERRSVTSRVGWPKSQFRSSYSYRRTVLLVWWKGSDREDHREKIYQREQLFTSRNALHQSRATRSHAGRVTESSISIPAPVKMHIRSKCNGNLTNFFRGRFFFLSRNRCFTAQQAKRLRDKYPRENSSDHCHNRLFDSAIGTI